MFDVNLFDYETSCDCLENAKECLSMIITVMENETKDKQGDDIAKALKGVYYMLNEVHKQFDNYLTEKVMNEFIDDAD